MLQALERRESDVRGVMGSSGLKYNVVAHHLHLLEAERVVVRKGGKKPYVWQLTGVGQQQLAYSSDE